MDKLKVFLKGTLMGICDIVPGISGGTIAFITGIYEKLISSVKGISPKFFKDLATFNKKELKKDIKEIDPLFLLVLLLGISIAIIFGSRVIKYLLDNYFAYTIAFFIGLVFASSKIIFDNIKNHQLKNILFGIVGLLIGICFAFLIPLNISPALSYVFLGGFLGISAMFLPGISGAFILLILGLYEFIINALHHPLENIRVLGMFILGMAFGAFTIARIISFLFKKYKSKTLYFLLGLVIGSLSVPVRNIFNTTLNPLEISLVFFFIFLGILIVMVVSNLTTKKHKN